MIILFNFIHLIGCGRYVNEFSYVFVLTFQQDDTGRSIDFE